MKNKKKVTLISCSVILFLGLTIGLIYYMQTTKTPELSKDFQEEIISYIEDWNIEELSEYSDEKMTAIAPIGKSSQMHDSLSKKKEVKEYVKIYKKERAKQEKFYKDNTKIKQSNIVHHKESNTYTQYITINSYSLTGYSIVYNDLLWFGTNLLSKEYTKKGVTKENAELFEIVDAKFRTYAIVKTNEHLNEFDERFTTTVELSWYFNEEENKWMCNNLDTGLNNLFDPENITRQETTGLYGKYHQIAANIMDEIIENKNFDELNPFNINNIK